MRIGKERYIKSLRILQKECKKQINLSLAAIRTAKNYNAINSNELIKEQKYKVELNQAAYDSYEYRIQEILDE